MIDHFDDVFMFDCKNHREGQKTLSCKKKTGGHDSCLSTSPESQLLGERSSYMKWSHVLLVLNVSRIMIHHSFPDNNNNHSIVHVRVKIIILFPFPSVTPRWVLFTGVTETVTRSLQRSLWLVFQSGCTKTREGTVSLKATSPTKDVVQPFNLTM